MKNFAPYLLTAMIMINGTTSCAQSTVTGSKKYITKQVAIENFHSIRLNGSPDVIYTQAPGNPSVEIYGSDNIVPLVETYVEDGTLIVQFKRNTNINNAGKLEVRASSPTLKMAIVRGSGDISFPDGIKNVDELKLTIQGSGDITGKKIECNRLKADVNGSGDISLSDVKTVGADFRVNGSGDISVKGTTTAANYYVNGSGDISASEFKAENVATYVNGSGDIRCHAASTLTGRVNGSGDVGYKGNPQITFSKKGLYRL